MIDEQRTLEIYGYTSDELSYGSGKPIVAVCDACGRYRVVQRRYYYILCQPCSKKGKLNYSYGKRHTEETKRKISKSKTNPSDEIRRKMSEAIKGKTHTEGTRRKISCGIQGIELKDWKGFAREKPYCDKFNESCKEHNREKYDNQCFICGKTKEENANRALSVHHVTKNKMEGCDGSKWRLIPLCGSCHGKAHFEPLESRINFLLND